MDANKKIVFSKKQWENIGKTVGWIKTSQANMEDLYSRFEGMQETKPIYVSLYQTSRHYGGPEEGGWHYDVSELKSSKKFFDREEAEAFHSQLHDWIEENDLNAEPLSSSRGLDKYPDPSGGDPMYDHSDDDIPVGFSGDATNYFAVIEEQVGELDNTKEPQHYE